MLYGGTLGSSSGNDLTASERAETCERRGWDKRRKAMNLAATTAREGFVK
jgi:hypothetical protein